MRRRLGLLSAAVTLTVVIAFVLPLAFLLRSVAADRAESAAGIQARSLAGALASITDERVIADLATQADVSSRRAVSVFLSDGSVYGSRATVDGDVRQAFAGRAFTASTSGGGLAVLVPVRRADGQVVVVRVAASGADVRQGVTGAWIALGGLGVVLVGIAVLLTDRLARPTVRSIEGLAATTHRLRAGDLEARASEAGLPEVREVASAVNRLAERITELLEAEREAAADVSHRLRTPLTALRLDLEGLPPGEAEARLAADLAVLEESVDEVIRETRRPPASVARTCDLVGVVVDRLAFWQVLAHEQGRSLTVAVPDVPAEVAVARSDLEAAIDALVGNVFSHTPAHVGTAVSVAAADGSSLWELAVDDAGPGLPSDEVPERGDGARRGSTGLGLDIARRTAARSGGSLRIGRSPLGGARVVMTLGVPRPDAESLSRR